jgi:hypothetical protein
MAEISPLRRRMTIRRASYHHRRSRRFSFTYICGVVRAPEGRQEFYRPGAERDLAGKPVSVTTSRAYGCSIKYGS